MDPEVHFRPSIAEKTEIERLIDAVGSQLNHGGADAAVLHLPTAVGGLIRKGDPGS